MADRVDKVDRVPPPTAAQRRAAQAAAKAAEGGGGGGGEEGEEGEEGGVLGFSTPVPRSGLEARIRTLLQQHHTQGDILGVRRRTSI